MSGSQRYYVPRLRRKRFGSISLGRGFDGRKVLATRYAADLKQLPFIYLHSFPSLEPSYLELARLTVCGGAIVSSVYWVLPPLDLPSILLEYLLLFVDPILHQALPLLSSQSSNLFAQLMAPKQTS